MIIARRKPPEPMDGPFLDIDTFSMYSPVVSSDIGSPATVSPSLLTKLIWHSRQALERVRICYIITWIRPKNVVINQLFGGWTGISLIPITLDVGLFGDRLHVALADFKSCC